MTKAAVKSMDVLGGTLPKSENHVCGIFVVRKSQWRAERYNPEPNLDK